MLFTYVVNEIDLFIKGFHGIFVVVNHRVDIVEINFIPFLFLLNLFKKFEIQNNWKDFLWYYNKRLRGFPFESSTYSKIFFLRACVVNFPFVIFVPENCNFIFSSLKYFSQRSSFCEFSLYTHRQGIVNKIFPSSPFLVELTIEVTRNQLETW